MITDRDKLGRIKPKYTEEQMRELAKKYLETKDSKKICEEAGVNKASFYYWMKKFEIKISKRRYCINEDYFSSIDAPNKAYILGFIMADGCVSMPAKTHTRPCRLQLNISKEDRIVLELIKEELQCDYEIKDYLPNESTYGNTEMSLLVVNSTKLCDDLAKYGVVQSKTGMEKVPQNIPIEMLPHYIRGYFDGDGFSYSSSTNYKDKTYKSTTIGFVAKTKESIEDLRNVLSKHTGIPKKWMKVYEEKRINEKGRKRMGWYLKLTQKECVQKLVSFMYKDNEFSLERKRIKLT